MSSQKNCPKLQAKLTVFLHFTLFWNIWGQCYKTFFMFLSICVAREKLLVKLLAYFLINNDATINPGDYDLVKKPVSTGIYSTNWNKQLKRLLIYITFEKLLNVSSKVNQKLKLKLLNGQKYEHRVFFLIHYCQNFIVVVSWYIPTVNVIETHKNTFKVFSSKTFT